MFGTQGPEVRILSLRPIGKTARSDARRFSLASLGLDAGLLDDRAPQLDLRERIALAGSDVRAGVHSKALLAWAAGPPLLVRMWPRWVAAAFCVAAIATAAVWGATGNSAPFVAVVVLEILFSTPLRVPVDTALHAASAPARMCLNIRMFHTLAMTLSNGTFCDCRNEWNPITPSPTERSRMAE